MTRDRRAKRGPTPMTERFDDALVFACRLHRQQARKGSGVPYISHLLAVAALVIEAGGDEDEAVAALLHDAVEDQGGPPTLREIGERFGARVAAIVAGCSDADGPPKPPWKQRKLDYIARLAGAAPSVLLVSSADKLHNARSILADYRRIGEGVWERFSGRREGTLWYYRAVTDAIRDAGGTPLSAELERTVAALERIAAA